MKKVYGIIGSGDVNEKALKASLNDLPKDAVYYVAHHKDCDSIEHIFDWLIDNEVEFVVVGKAGAVLAKYAEEIKPADDTLDSWVLRYVEGCDPTILVLWDENVDKEVITAANYGYPILELSNGLSPIIVADDTPPVVEEPTVEPETVEADPEGFSDEELAAMPVAALKRYAISQGIDIKGMTKADIIVALAGDIVRDMEVPVEVPAETPVVSQSKRPVAVILVMDNGSSVTVHGDADTMDRILAVL